MKSLDPRVNRLPRITNTILPKVPLDQFGTFEVFVEPKEGKPFQHEGSVHSPDIELAFVLAKETFTRRFTCTALAVVETRNVFVSPITEGNSNVYDLIGNPNINGDEMNFEIFHLAKRGKQHVHAGQIKATSHAQAIFNKKMQLAQDKIIFNVWVIKTSDIRFSTVEEKDLWLTLADKKFRDAADYKGGDKLKEFLDARK
jgi:ring-1,2-phenylacetyl-CoA epoxidase subunit PaaB